MYFVTAERITSFVSEDNHEQSSKHLFLFLSKMEAERREKDTSWFLEMKGWERREAKIKGEAAKEREKVSKFTEANNLRAEGLNFTWLDFKSMWHLHLALLQVSFVIAN